MTLTKKNIIRSLFTCLAATGWCAMAQSGLTVTPSTLTFNSQSGSTPAAQSVSITSSSGVTAFTATAFSSGNWLTVNPSGAMTTPQTLTVSVDPTKLTAPTETGFISIVTATGTTVVQVLANSNTTGATPFSSNPAQLSFTFPAGSLVPATHDFTITSTSTNAATLTATAVANNSGTWLQVAPASTSIGASSTATFTATVNPAALGPGTYTGAVVINEFGSTTPGVTVPVSVTVSGTPTLAVAPASLSFAYQIGTASTPPTQSLSITSSAGSVVNYTISVNPGSTCPSGWLVVGSSGGVTPSTIPIQVNTNAISQIETCGGTINISAPGASNPAVTIPVTLLATTSPILNVPSTGLTFDYVANGPAPAAQTVAISTSSSALQYSVSIAPSGTNGTGPVFVTATPASGSASAQAQAMVSFAINPQAVAALAPGTYVDNVTVSAQGAGNQPVTFPVTLIVSFNATLVPSEKSLTFNYEIGQTPPPSQVIALASTGAPLQYSVTTTGFSSNCPNFLTVAPASGITIQQPGLPPEIAATVNTTGLTTPATCTGTISVTVAGSQTPALTIPVTMNVVNTPVVNATPSVITATALAGSTTAQTFQVALTSTDLTTPLNFTATAATNPAGGTWLLVTPQTGGHTPANLSVTVNPTGLPAGTYTGTITVAGAAPNASIPSMTIAVMLTLYSSQISGAPASLTFTQPVGGQAPATQTLTISGLPAGTTIGAFATPISGGNGWLTVTTGANNTVVVGANAGTLAQGTYTGYVTVLAPGAAGSPFYVPVTFTVGAPQTLAVSSPSVTLNYAVGGQLPANATVQVTSTGGNVPVTASFSPVSGTCGNFITVTPTEAQNTPATFTLALNPDVQSSLTAGTCTGTLTISSTSIQGGNKTVAIALNVAAAAVPTVTTVVNAATFVPGAIAPGELVTIEGMNLGPSTAAGTTLDNNGNVETMLGSTNTQVLFNGVAAPLTYVSATQINAVVPYEIAGQTAVTMQVKNNGVTSSTLSLQVANLTPGIFTLHANGTGQAAVINQDNTINGTGAFQNVTLHPAPRGSVIALYATGGGILSPLPGTGSVTPLTPPFATFPSSVGVAVTIGGVTADVVYAGPAPGAVSGALQINVRVPQDAPAGDDPVVLYVGGISSPAGVTVNVQ